MTEAASNLPGGEQASPSPGLAYKLLRQLLRLAVRVFYRRVEVVGYENVPVGKPVVFCGNHPNSLLDPILIIVFCGRIVHFAAKDVLFQSKFLNFFMTRLGAVPIMRKKDHPDGALDNNSAFSKLFEVLRAGRCMGIFPEGISHLRPELAKIKTGAARIALGAEADAPGSGVCVVPCGLHYVRRHRFRSSVLVQFGEAIELDSDWVAAYQEDERATVAGLTAEIEHGLRGLTVNADDWDTIRVLDGVRRLYQPQHISLHDRVELARRFNTVYPTVKDEPQVRAIYERMHGYLGRLTASGLSDRDLKGTTTRRELIWRTIGHFARLLFWVPLAVIGAPVHVPLALALGWTGERLAPRKDVVATTKFLAGLFTYLLVYAVVAGVAAWNFGWLVGLWVFLLLPLTGHATLVVLERFDAIDRKVHALGRLLRYDDELESLRSEREALEGEIVRAVQQLIPDDMTPLFPREPEQEAPA